VRQNVAISLRRQRALLGLLVAIVAALLACNGVVGAGVSRYASTAQQRSALNLIELSSVASSARRELSDDTLREVASVPGVTGVYPWFQVDLSLSDSADWPDPGLNPGAIWGTPVIPGLEPRALQGSLPADGPAAGQIALPHSVPGGTLDHLLGRDVTLEYTRVVGPGEGAPSRVTFRVVAIVDNGTPGDDGPSPSYVALESLRSMLSSAGSQGNQPATYRTAYARVQGPDDVARVQTELASRGFAVSSLATRMSSLGGLFGILRLATWVFAALLALVCLAVGSAIGSAWVTQRTREVGLLKAIGWGPRRITGSLLLELGVVGLIASVIGSLLGTVLSLVLTAWVAHAQIDLLPVEAWQTPGLPLTLAAVAMVPVCIWIGSARSAIRVARVDADDALRDL